jgi:hypothetical protein
LPVFGRVVREREVADGILLLEGQELPLHRILVVAVQDRLEVKVWPGGAPRLPHDTHDLPGLDAVPGLHRGGLHVVVRGHEAVPVVDFNPVAAAPRMPTGGTHDPGVGRVDPGALGSGEVLAPVELPRLPGQRIDAIAEGRSGY